SRDSFDIIILNNKIEIKTATEDIGGSFQFNGVRYHRQYDFIFVLGIAPNNIYFNIYSAADIKTGKAGNLVTMEKGTSGSYKLTKKKSELIDFVEFKNILKSNLKQL
ncbi:MAG: hypothetical protein ORN58_02785, partial [Sediminibacterium sp.]|nr:hypothetical protein [Sediminibacterium sp.]